MGRWVRPALMVLVLLGLVLSLGWLVAKGIGDISDGGPNAWFGVGLILLAVIGLWSTVVLVRAGLQLQRISARAADEGFELSIDELPRRPSGRLQPEAAHELFQQVAREYEAAPEDWRVLYRLARAYDYAGDRGRGREFMKQALAGEAAERKATDG